MMNEYSVGEEAGSVSICVESGGFEAALTVSLMEQHVSYIIIHSARVSFSFVL